MGGKYKVLCVRPKSGSEIDNIALGFLKGSQPEALEKQVPVKEAFYFPSF